MADVDNLNYECTYNLFIGRAFLHKLKTTQERLRANRWLKKIQEACIKNLDDLRTRNRFVFRLATQIKSGELEAPFDREPPTTQPLVEMEEWALEKMSVSCPGDPEGNFLLPRLPKIGALCYLSVISDLHSDDEEAD